MFALNKARYFLLLWVIAKHKNYFRKQLQHETNGFPSNGIHSWLRTFKVIYESWFENRERGNMYKR